MISFLASHLRRRAAGARFMLGLVLAAGLATGAHAAYEGPVPAPTDAYGSPGPYRVARQSFARPDRAGLDVTVFYPEGAGGPWPTWFFAHGFGGSNVAYYEELLTHLASHGAAAVFSPYPAEVANTAQNYALLFDGFAEAAQRFPGIIDPSRAVFAGHSYGGGAAPALALRGVREKGWGKHALGLLLLAPWYSYFVSDADLASFPAGTLAVVQIYEDDMINDHRMAIDLFSHLALAPDDKDFLMLRSDRIDGYNYAANHRVPTGQGAPGVDAKYNALDVWGVHRIAQALGAAVWRGDAAARRVALGHGSAEQVTMGATSAGRALRPMVESRTPVPLFPSSRYWQRFDGLLNPRRGAALPPSARVGYLRNLSARARSGPGDDVLIVGATVKGARPKSLLLRAVGPGLAPFGVADPLPDPRLAVYGGSTLDLEVDNWAEAPELEALAAATTETGAFALAEGSADAALLASYPPGNLTAHAASASGAAGVALLELYDAEEDRTALLSGLSARARVGGGEEVLVAGFVTAGEDLPVLVRAVGPALGGVGVAGAVADPLLEVYRGSTLVASNDDWSADATQRATLAATAQRLGLMAMAEGSKDAALLLALPPGSYTALVRSRGAAGLGLVEVYSAQ